MINGHLGESQMAYDLAKRLEYLLEFGRGFLEGEISAS